MEKKSERRSYYRINDIVGLRYVILKSTEEEPPEKLGDLGMPMTSLFAQIDRELNQTINTLWHENPTLAQALGLLNRKISLIAAHGQREEGQTIDSYEELLVNISGSGLAFSCIEELPVGTRLRLLLALTPSDIHINFTGEVVACEQSPKNSTHPYWIRVTLDSDNPAAQEQLIQHIVQKQCAQVDTSRVRSGS